MIMVRKNFHLRKMKIDLYKIVAKYMKYSFEFQEVSNRMK